MKARKSNWTTLGDRLQWCVYVQGKHGAFVGLHVNGLRAVYYRRAAALEFARDLRQHRLKASVRRCRIQVEERER